jgi:hypothetical protein
MSPKFNAQARESAWIFYAGEMQCSPPEWRRSAIQREGMAWAPHFRHRHMVGAITHRKLPGSIVPIELFVGLLLALAIVAFGFVAYFAFASTQVVP